MSQEENMTLNKDMEELKVIISSLKLKPVRKIYFYKFILSLSTIDI